MTLYGAGHYGVAPETDRRRQELVEWLRERDQHNGLTAREIADVSGIYRMAFGKADRAFDDLKALDRQGVVIREGRPARWSLHWAHVIAADEKQGTR